MLKTIHFLSAGYALTVTAGFVSLATSTSSQAALIAGIDMDVAGNFDSNAATPNTILTEPGFLSVLPGASKDYNVVHNGITFNLDGTSVSGNANRARTGAISNFPLTTDFMQLYSAGSAADPALKPTMVVTITGLNPNTPYTVSFYNYNAGAFQDPHEYYAGAIAPANLLGIFTATGAPNVPETYNPGVDWDLTSNANGEIVVSIQPGGTGERLTLNGIAVTPEPSSLALLGLGGLLVSRRRRI